MYDFLKKLISNTSSDITVKKIAVMVILCFLALICLNFITFLLRHFIKLSVVALAFIFAFKLYNVDTVLAAEPEITIDLLKDIISAQKDNYAERSSIEIEINTCKNLLAIIRTNLYGVQSTEAGNLIANKASDVILALTGKSLVNVEYGSYYPCIHQAVDRVTFCMILLDVLKLYVRGDKETVEKIKERVEHAKVIVLDMSVLANPQQ